MLKKFRQLTASWYQKKTQFPRQVVTVKDKNYLLRELTTDDIKALILLQKEVYAGQLPWTRSAFLAEFTSPLQHLYLGVELEGQLIAFGGCRISEHDGHITNVAVLPVYQRSGLGSLLLAELEKFALSHHCHLLSLEVRLSNRHAQRLYRKRGFVSRAIKRGYYDESNEDALDMVKSLEY